MLEEFYDVFVIKVCILMEYGIDLILYVISLSGWRCDVGGSILGI